MTDETQRSKRLLEPIERISEVLFGLIMVLTFTGSLSVAEAGHEDVRAMLLAALGCNLAWGIIDAVLYLMGCLAERGRSLMTLQALRRTVDSSQAQPLIAAALPPLVAAVLQPQEIDAIYRRLRNLPEPPTKVRLGRDDWLGALGVLLLVFLSTFPVTIPFLLMSDPLRALRVSNAVALVLLFLTGHAFGRATGRGPVATGISMVLLGSVLVGLTIALGG